MYICMYMDICWCLPRYTFLEYTITCFTSTLPPVHPVSVVFGTAIPTSLYILENVFILVGTYVFFLVQ